MSFNGKCEKFFVKFEQAYGYRGNHPAVYYLSPWEFTALWKLEYLKQPSAYTSNAKTRWTAAGLLYKDAINDDKDALAPKAGEHYEVIPSMDASRQSFEEN